MRARRSLGQNFLVDPNYQRKIVEAIDPSPDEHLLEIGPGRGALTRHLVGAVDHLTLVELDGNLVAELESEFGGRDDVTIVHGDILDVRLSDLLEPARSRVVGNIPYNITTPILFHALRRPRPVEIVLMVQREVAERVTAEPGTSAYGALSVGVRSVATAERSFGVPRSAFRPVPGVDSAVLRIRPHAPPPLDEGEEEHLRVLTRAFFQWRRKQIQKTLRQHPDLGFAREVVDALESELGLDFRNRPERLSPQDFVRLSAALRARR